MGLNEHDSNSVYLYPISGKLARKMKVATAQTVSRVNKNGDTVHELLYDSLDGVITNLKTENSDYGKQLRITMHDFTEHQDYIVRIPLRSQYSYGIFKRIGNIDFSRVLKLKPYTIDDGKSSKSGFTVYQDGQKVPLAFSKDEPNGMPDLEEIVVKGEETWDDTKRLFFFIELMQKEVIPVIVENSKRVSMAYVSEQRSSGNFIADLPDSLDDMNDLSRENAYGIKPDEETLEEPEPKQKSGKKPKKGKEEPDTTVMDEIDDLPF